MTRKMEKFRLPRLCIGYVVGLILVVISKWKQNDFLLWVIGHYLLHVGQGHINRNKSVLMWIRKISPHEQVNLLISNFWCSAERRASSRVQYHSKCLDRNKFAQNFSSGKRKVKKSKWKGGSIFLPDKKSTKLNPTKKLKSGHRKN